MATIQIKRFEGVDVDLDDKSEILEYGELAVNVDDNRLWVGSNGNGNVEITQQIIFQEYRPEDVANYPQPTIYRAGQLWWDTNTGTGQKLYISHKGTGGGDVDEWRDVSGGGGFIVVRYLNDLVNVQTQNTEVGHVLAWNGTVWDSTAVTVENLPNVDSDYVNGTQSTHGQVLMYDDHIDKWTPQNAPYDGAVLTPHTHYVRGSDFGNNPIAFNSRWTADPEIHQYGDTYFCIGRIGWYNSDTTNSLSAYRLTDTSIANGWSEKNIIFDPPDADTNSGGVNRYFKVVKKFSGSNGFYEDAASVEAIRNWSTERYGFQVRGNASLELVKMEWLQPPEGTSDPFDITMENDANILIVYKTSSMEGSKSGMNLSGDSFTPYYIDDDNNILTNAGFVTKGPWPRDTGATVTVTPYAAPGFSGWTWKNQNGLNQELHVSQWRITQGTDASDIAENPAFDFLEGAVDQDVLVYNNGEWGPVNKPPLGNNALEEIGDVDVTGVADGDALVWDSANTKWKPYTIPATPALYIEKQYNFTGPIEINNGVLRYYLPADISEIRITPYLVAPSTDGRVGAYLNYDGVAIAFAVLQTGETVGEETVITGTYTKGKYLTVEITDAGTNAQYLSLLLSLKRA